MKEFPLSVVIAALIKENKILLIKREQGNYTGFWSLPGGKVEKNEHLSEAITREIYEECGIICKFKNHLGFVSEHLKENEKILQHFLLHICELEEKSKSKKEPEGELLWADLNNLEEIKKNIIPSDFQIIQKIIKNKEAKYYNCIVEKQGNNHQLKKFEKI